MSLISPTLQPPSPTVLNALQVQNTMCLQVMKSTAKNVFEIVWHNGSLTPQQVCDAMGVDAVKGFDAHSALQELIYAIDPSWVPLEPAYNYTKNANGTVTIGSLKV